MANLPSVTGRRVQRALERDGWVVARVTGHIVMEHPIKPGPVILPNHPSATVATGTLRGIPRDAGLTADEFRALL